jgi:hypothetical protein
MSIKNFELLKHLITFFIKFRSDDISRMVVLANAAHFERQKLQEHWPGRVLQAPLYEKLTESTSSRGGDSHFGTVRKGFGKLRCAASGE